MAISVIISNFNGAKYLPRLLETLKAQKAVTLEIIVVDRNSTDDSSAILARHPDVKVIQEPPESGLVAGYAVGVPNARHEHLFFCNEDMWFLPDCLTLCETQMDAVARVGAVMPVQLSYDGSFIVNSGSWFTKSRWERTFPYPLRAFRSREIRVAQTLSGVNAGACLVRRVAYEDVGGWDTTFFLDYEDTDLSLRLWQRGWVCRIQPRAVVHHAVGASNAKPIHNGRMPVGRKRYVWQFSNQMAIAWKTFSGLALGFPVLLWLDRILRDLVRFRGKSVWLDVAAGWLTLCRLPSILAYRKRNSQWNRQKPGQQWFSEPDFDASQMDISQIPPSATSSVKVS